MKVKRKAIRWLTSALAVTLITSNTAVAATWKQDASGTWYHYNDQNVKTVGWYHDTDGKWYYLMSDGKMLANTWFQDSDQKRYYLSDSGAMLTDAWHQEANGSWHYFSASGAMLTNTVTPDGYTVRADGTWNQEVARLVNTWYQAPDQKIYRFSETGMMYRNAWHQETDGKWYYFSSDGSMLAGCLTPDGYTLNADGTWNTAIAKKEVQSLGPGGGTGTGSSGSRSSGGGGGGGSHSSGGGGGSHSSGGNSSNSGNTDNDSGETTKPDTPSEPSTPEKPDTPKPSEPDTPTTPDTPEKPDTPENPDEPEKEPETIYAYSIKYKDIKSGQVLSEVAGNAKKGTTISIDHLEFDGYDICEDQPASFDLTSNNKSVNIYYERTPEAASPSELQVNWEVRFVDKETNNKQLSPKRNGKIKEGGTLYINYMSKIVDGSDIWEAIKEPPMEVTVYGPGDQIYYVEYELTGNIPEPDDPELAEKNKLNEWLDTAKDYESDITGEDAENISSARFFVSNQNDNDIRVRSMVGQLDDTGEVVFYIIGKNFKPNGIIIPNVFENVVYSNLTEDEITFGGDTYYVVRMSVERSYDPETCTHRWRIANSYDATCLARGKETYECEKCGTEMQTVTPALGHIDEDNDSVCDRCGQRTFEQEVGSKISANIRIEGGTKRNLTFTCIDDDYQGGMLYISNEAIPLTDFDGYGDMDYENSNVRNYFHGGFTNGFSIAGDALMPIKRDDNVEVDYAMILTEAQQAQYKDVIPNTSDYLVRKPGSTTLVGIQTDGSKKDVTDPDSETFGIRPVILLAKPDAGTAEPIHWNIGDIVAKEIDGETYMFQCIDQNYSDRTENHKEAALFLCTSVIAADTGSEYEYEEQLDGTMDYVFYPGPIVNFGNSNDYKYSKIQKWLNSSSEDFYNCETINIGVDYAYMGATNELRYSELDEDQLKPYYIGNQKLTGKLFSLSVDEALKYKDYLWKFEGSDTENPESQYGTFSKAYWLRNPMGMTNEYNETKQVYVVDLVNGNIHPNTIKPETDIVDEELKVTSTVGVRPAFVMPQE